MVVQSDTWLTVAGETQHLRPGDLFELANSEPHAERYGSAGANQCVARLNG